MDYLESLKKGLFRVFGVLKKGFLVVFGRAYKKRFGSYVSTRARARRCHGPGLLSCRNQQTDFCYHGPAPIHEFEILTIRSTTFTRRARFVDLRIPDRCQSFHRFHAPYSAAASPYRLTAATLQRYCKHPDMIAGA